MPKLRRLSNDEYHDSLQAHAIEGIGQSFLSHWIIVLGTWRVQDCPLGISVLLLFSGFPIKSFWSNIKKLLSISVAPNIAPVLWLLDCSQSPIFPWSRRGPSLSPTVRHPTLLNSNPALEVHQKIWHKTFLTVWRSSTEIYVVFLIGCFLGFGFRAKVTTNQRRPSSVELLTDVILSRDRMVVS